MALDSFPLIARQSQDAEGPMQVKALQIVFDMLILYGINFGVERNFGVRRPLPLPELATHASRSISPKSCSGSWSTA